MNTVLRWIIATLAMIIVAWTSPAFLPGSCLPVLAATYLKGAVEETDDSEPAYTGDEGARREENAAGEQTAVAKEYKKFFYKGICNNETILHN